MFVCVCVCVCVRERERESVNECKLDQYISCAVLCLCELFLSEHETVS